MLLLFSPLILDIFQHRISPRRLILRSILPLSYFAYNLPNINIILLSVILETISLNYDSRLIKGIRLLNRGLLSVSTLFILINFDRYNLYLLIMLSIQFLLALFVALKFFSRNCFYIIPITTIPLTIIFNINHEPVYLLSGVGLVIYSALENRRGRQTREDKINEIKKSSLITTNLITKIHEDISAGVESRILLSNILGALNKFIGNDTSGIELLNIDEQIEFISTEGFIPIDLNGLEQKEHHIENLEECIDSNFYKHTRSKKKYISSIIVHPIKTTSRLIGYLIIENKTFGKKLEIDSLIKSRLFLSIIETAIESLDKNREIVRKKELERDIEIASNIQKQLIRDEVKLHEGSVSVISKAAKGMNGDFFNVLPLKGNRTLLAICDVAGKGIPAALVTVIIHTTIRIFASEVTKASALVEKINRVLCSSVNIERYATLCVLIIDHNSRYISFANAGHHPPMIKRENCLFELKGNGLPAGVTPTTKYEEVNFPYNINDQIVLYTDGIVESVNEDGVHFDSNGIKEIFKNQKSNIPLHFISNIYQKSEEHSYKNFNFDDRTIIGVKL